MRLPAAPAAPRPEEAGRSLRIARARPSDAAALAAVMRASVRRLARGVHGPREIAAWSSLPPLYHAWAMTVGGEICFVARARARVVGYASLRGHELTAVFVHPAASRRGVGTALLRRVEREASRRGVSTLHVKAALAALHFYRAMGFVGGRAVRVPLPGGVSLAARALRKQLS